jgi:hypothetical protein
MLDTLTQFSERALTKLKVKSALNPCLWLCGISLPFGIYLLIWGQGLAQTVGAWLTLVPVAIFAVAFLYLIVKDPDKLRSEEYELRKLALGLIEQKGGAMPLTAVSIEVIANPTYQALPKFDGEA